METIYKIPTQNIEHFRSAIEKQAKKAKKLGMPDIGFTDHGLESLSINGRPYIAHKITIHGERPVISGWEFIGILTHEREMPDPILHSVSTKISIPDQYKSCPPNCDHCHTNRQRSKTYIIKKDGADEFKQIGSGCLTDFFGGKNPHDVAAYAEILASLHRFGWHFANDFSHLGDKQEDYYDNKTILEKTCAVVSEFGYISNEESREYGDISTTMRLREHFQFSAPIPKIYPEHTKKADDVIAWIMSDEFRSQSETETSGYLHNIRKIAEFGKVSAKNLGFIVSAVQAHDRHLEKLRMQEQMLQSNFIGEEKQRLDHLAVTLRKKRDFDSRYGLKVLHVFSDGNNNAISWYNTGHPLRCKLGEHVHITGTVYRHDDYKGIKQTELKRVVCHEDKLLSAIHQGDLSAVNKLLKLPTNLSVRETDSLTPLMLACRSGHLELVKTLLEAGCDPKECTNDGHAGFFAVYPSQNHDGTGDVEREDTAIEIIKMLIEKSPDILAIPRRVDGKTINDISTERLKSGIENLLLEKSIQLDDIDDSPSFSF